MFYTSDTSLLFNLCFSYRSLAYLESVGAVESAQCVSTGDVLRVKSSGGLQFLTGLVKCLVLPRILIFMLVTNSCEEPQVPRHVVGL